MMWLIEDPLIKRFLWLPLGILLVLSLLFTLLYFGLDYQKEQTQKNVMLKTKQLGNVMRQVKFLRYQEQLFLTYGDKYQALIKDGLVHRQDRVKWTDSLLKIQKELALKPFVIQYEPEQKLTQKYLQQIKLDKDIFYFTRLNLTLGLHSDLDILYLINKIAAQVTPLFVVEKCHLGAALDVIEKPEFDPRKGMIKAQCSLILFEAKPNPFKVVE